MSFGRNCATTSTPGQLHHETCPSPGPVINPNRPTVRPDVPQHDRQAESVARIVSPSLGDEPFEDPVAPISWNPLTGVLDGDQDATLSG